MPGSLAGCILMHRTSFLPPPVGWTATDTILR